jgi:malonate-semialdehyde dehydrogenase (acetylating)/methylmalonate-semialdehyde dehydrogenase
MFQSQVSFLCLFSTKALKINMSIVPLPMFSFTGNKKSIAGGGASYFYGKPGLQFYTQLKTVTSFWSSADAVSKAADVSMPTHS